MKKSKKYISLLLSILMVLLSFNYVFADETLVNDNDTSDSYKAELSDLQNQQKEIQAKQTELNKKITSTKNEVAKQKLIANSIDEEIDLIKQEINICKEKIELTENYISNKERQIKIKEIAIEKNLQIFRDRIKAMYMSGGYSDSANALIMLFGSSSFSEFLTRAEYLKRIAEHDTELVEELKEELDGLQGERNLLLVQKDELTEDNNELEEKQSELEAKYQSAKSSIQDLSAMQKEYEENYSELSSIAKQIQSEIADVYKSLNLSNTAYVGGEMLWPCPNYSNISCYYGWRFNNTDFHTGIDISGSGIHGAKVVAANTGTVIFTKTCPYNGYSYGYGTYVIIDHGGNITTLYGHLSNITVQVGDIVAMGEQIGNVGNTGWSTGAHLHFEVRKNGSSVNPLPYVTG